MSRSNSFIIGVVIVMMFVMYLRSQTMVEPRPQPQEPEIVACDTIDYYYRARPTQMRICVTPDTVMFENAEPLIQKYPDSVNTIINQLKSEL